MSVIFSTEHIVEDARAHTHTYEVFSSKIISVFFSSFVGFVRRLDYRMPTCERSVFHRNTTLFFFNQRLFSYIISH